jgi:membrane protein DedA with SNARE-associated domain
VYLPCTAFAAAIWTVGYFLVGLLLERPARRAIAFFQRDADAAVATIALVVLVALGITLLVRRYRANRVEPEAQRQ